MLMRSWEPRTAETTARLINYVVWPLAVMTVLNRAAVKAVNGFRTDDFAPVYQAALAFLNRRPVYTADFSSTDPHYLYPPSGTLLMAPLAVIDPERARWLFIGVNTIAIIAAVLLLLRMFDVRLSSPLTPVALLFAFYSETVTNTLVFTNVNGLVLLGEVCFMFLLLRRKQYWAGAAIGLTLAIKPTLAPLLLIPLVRKEWRVFVTAVSVPAILTALAWPLSVDPMSFVRKTVPYLSETRDYYNSSISGNSLYYGLPTWLTLAIQALFAVLTVVTLYLLWRFYRHDDLLFVATTSGVLLTASWLLSSLSQMYYSMMLFPLLLTVVLRNSMMRNWPAWLGVYGFMSYDSWLITRFPTTGRAAEYMKTTFGWSLLIIAITTVLVGRYLRARAAGRLDDGIDPPELREPNPTPAGLPSAKTA